MPIIAYKTMRKDARMIQARRIECENCKQPFTYLIEGTYSSTSTGLPLLSSDDGMRKSAFNSCRKKIEAHEKPYNAGEGICPHCKSYRSWMVKNSRKSCIKNEVIIGLVLGIIIGLIALVSLKENTNMGLLAGGAIFIAFCILSGVIGSKFAIKEGEQPKKENSRSMADAEVNELIQTCMTEEREPVMMWYASTGGTFYKKGINISLGFRDQAGGLEVPQSMSTQEIMDGLQA